MASVSLSASVRDTRGKGAARVLRREGRVPAVIYGHGRDPQSLSIDARELEKLLTRISPAATVIELGLDAGVARTLIREIQRHPFKRHVVHVDFQELVAGEKVTVRVPIRLVGTPEGVRLSGGILEQVVSEVEIVVDPSNIPDHIDVDVTKLGLGHSLHVSDITFPEGVEVLSDEDTTVASLVAPKTAEAAPGEGGDGVAEPELIRKAKADDDAK